ncbi:MAG: UDP-N-acetylglucosamine 1-carboxyvinyltransferase [Rickettsiales bacterium]|nr:UDP-N-acetylglucosamine 1-carboxyvinyltransferase [Rickettsiales bacterium]
MDILKIQGGARLKGKVKIAGSKNSALPIIASALTTDKEISLSNVPNLSDIQTMIELLQDMGADVNFDAKKNQMQIKASKLKSVRAEYEIVKKMRASVIVLGGLVARYGKAEVSLPGGCAIGARPINYHLMALEKLGAKIELENGYVKASVKGRLKGAEIDFPKVSVGATENTIIAASLAKGLTIINNPAREPEIVDLANILNSMGAKISGAGTSRIEIEGVEDLQGTNHKIIPDRIEAGTFAAASALTAGEVEITGINPEMLNSSLKVFEEMGCEIIRHKNSFSVNSPKKLKPANVATEAFPGFPTDMQAQITTMMCIADGISTMEENIFENRFMHVPELQRMGANIEVSGNMLKIKGIDKFTSAEVMATDLRASVSLILAGFNAKGITSISRVYHLDRGYEKIEEKFEILGGKIWREKE